MKRILILFCCFSFLLSASEIYKLEKIGKEEIYFPIKNYEYIQNLLDDNTSESYFELSLVYATLGRKDIAEKYLKIYEKESNNYLKISKIYNAMGEYYKEIEYLKTYLKDKDIKEKQEKYDYILELAKKNNLLIDENEYKINEINILLSNINNEDKFYSIYSNYEWNKKEKNIIVENLISLDLENKELQMKIFNENASKYDKLKYYYKRIKNIGDFENFKKYFEFAEKNEIDLEFIDEYEKIQYLKYKNNLEVLKKEYDRKLNEDIEKNNYEGLYSLYLINEDLKIIYNLALENEERFYEFILFLDKIKNEKLLNSSIENFKNKYKKSSFALNLNKIKFKYIKDDKKKLNEINKFLKENFDIGILNEKIKILKEFEDIEIIKKELKDIILKKYEYPELIEYYIELNEKDNKEDLENILKNLDNKFYYLDFCLKNNIKIEEKYKSNLKKYYFDKKEYGKLKDYKLSEKEHETLLNNGYLNFIEKARKDYPLNENWKNLNSFKFLFFNNDKENEYKEYDLSFVEEIEKIARKRDSEYYFLIRYYLYKENYNKAKEYLNKIYYKYNAFYQFKDLNEKINLKLKEINTNLTEEEKKYSNEDIEF